MLPAARYAKSGDLEIAYVTAGNGPIDVVWVPSWISHCEHLWAEPSIAATFERITQFARLIMFDRRGSGLSGPILGAPTLEEQMDDVLAVMDAVGCERAALMGSLEGGPLAMTFAACHPERTTASSTPRSRARGGRPTTTGRRATRSAASGSSGRSSSGARAGWR